MKCVQVQGRPNPSMENGGEHKVPSLDKEQWASDSAKSKDVFFESIGPGKFTTHSRLHRQNIQSYKGSTNST